jgi:hypothetical protein
MIKDRPRSPRRSDTYSLISPMNLPRLRCPTCHLLKLDLVANQRFAHIHRAGSDADYASQIRSGRVICGAASDKSASGLALPINGWAKLAALRISVGLTEPRPTNPPFENEDDDEYEYDIGLA